MCTQDNYMIEIYSLPTTKTIYPRYYIVYAKAKRVRMLIISTMTGKWQFRDSEYEPDEKARIKGEMNDDGKKLTIRAIFERGKW